MAERRFFGPGRFSLFCCCVLLSSYVDALLPAPRTNQLQMKTIKNLRTQQGQRTACTEMSENYSTKVKITAENRAPLRQARIFFLYPSAIAGASIGAYVALTRLIAGVAGFRSDVIPLNEGGNLLVDLAVVAAAVYFLRSDLKARDEQLQQISKELGEFSPAELADDSVEKL